MTSGHIRIASFDLHCHHLGFFFFRGKLAKLVSNLFKLITKNQNGLKCNSYKMKREKNFEMERGAVIILLP